MVVGRGNDAIPTWSGFNYQGKMMLLYVLVQKFLNKWTIFLFCSILFSSNQKEH